jgi:hypothetical protein
MGVSSPAAMKICFLPNEPGNLLKTKGTPTETPIISGRTQQLIQNKETRPRRTRYFPP